MTEEALIARAAKSLRREYERGEITLAYYRHGLDIIRNMNKPKQKGKDNGNLCKKAK